MPQRWVHILLEIVRLTLLWAALGVFLSMLEAGSDLLRAKVHTALRDLLRGAGPFQVQLPSLLLPSANYTR